MPVSFINVNTLDEHILILNCEERLYTNLMYAARLFVTK